MGRTVDRGRLRPLKETVLRGVTGLGAHSRIHTAKVLQLSEDLPVVIEIVDKPEQIQAILPLLEEMVGEGLITLENVHVIACRLNRGSVAGRRRRSRVPEAPRGRSPPIARP